MLALLYHRVGDGKYANIPAMMEAHMDWIANHCQTVLPGDRLHWLRRNVCLTFDDATFDFYHYVFPLLKKYGLRALLAVPVRYIQDSTRISAEERLSIPYSMAMKDHIYQTHCPFCTWAELKEMVQSNLVTIASHSFNHKNLLLPDLDLELEIVGSKRVLEQKLARPIQTFVYPLGKFNREIHQKVKQHYDFAMRIGTAWNFSWQNQSGMIYRVICDNMKTSDAHFRFYKKLNYLWFYLINSFRGR